MSNVWYQPDEAPWRAIECLKPLCTFCEEQAVFPDSEEGDQVYEFLRGPSGKIDLREQRGDEDLPIQEHTRRSPMPPGASDDTDPAGRDSVGPEFRSGAGPAASRDLGQPCEHCGQFYRDVGGYCDCEQDLRDKRDPFVLEGDTTDEDESPDGRLKNYLRTNENAARARRRRRETRLCSSLCGEFGWAGDQCTSSPWCEAQCLRREEQRGKPQ